MLEPLLPLLKNQRIVLASQSPRRKQILDNVHFPCEVVASTFEENLDQSHFEHPFEYAVETARKKALDVAARLSDDKKEPDLVIGADTVVSLDNMIYGKPKNKEDAFVMLTKLSGKCHLVHTGVALIMHKPDFPHLFHTHTFHESTDVYLGELSPSIINSYIETGEPMDKAGGYGIQGIGATIVSSITGDYYTVMGFPLHRFCVELRKLYTDMGKLSN